MRNKFRKIKESRLPKFTSIYSKRINENSWSNDIEPSDEQLSDPIEKAKFIVSKLKNGKYSSVKELYDKLSEIIIGNSLWYAKNPTKEIQSLSDVLFKISSGSISDENRDTLIQALSKEFVKWNKMVGLSEARVLESAIATQNFFHLIGQDSVKFATYANDNGISSGKFGNVYFSDFDNTLTLFFKEKEKAERIYDEISDVAEEYGCKIEIVDGSIEIHDIKNFKEATHLVESKLSYNIASKSSTRDKILSFIGGGENFRRKNSEYISYINSVNEDSDTSINRNYVNSNSHLFRKFDIGKESYIGLTKIGRKLYNHIMEGGVDNDDIISGLNITLSKIIDEDKFRYNNGLFEANIENLGDMTVDEISEELSELSETFGGLLVLEEITTDPDIIKIKYTK